MLYSGSIVLKVNGETDIIIIYMLHFKLVVQDALSWLN